MVSFLFSQIASPFFIPFFFNGGPGPENDPFALFGFLVVFPDAKSIILCVKTYGKLPHFGNGGLRENDLYQGWYPLHSS